MRVLISAIGSHGDMLPFIGLAGVLRDRGHSVRLYGNGMFAALAAAGGVDFVETGDADSTREAMADSRVTKTRSGLGLVAEGVMASVLPTFQAMAADVLPGQTLIVGSSLAFGPRLLAEARQLPFAAVHLAPSMFRSDHLAPRLSPLGHFERWPRLIKRATWALMDRRFLDPAFCTPLNRIRADLGLPSVRRVWHDWIHQGVVTVGLFPEWLAPRQPDWPRDLSLVGFPMYDGDQAMTMSAELQVFLDAGTAPVVFTAGTGNTTSERFYAESAASCQRLGLRGVLIGQRSQLPATLPPNVLHVAYAPFSQLFRRSAAVVHHGGIGTLSQALRAGVPQLIRPMAYDQFDNSSRACRLGVAKELLPRVYGRGRLDATLRGLLNDSERRATCERIAARMRRQDGLANLCVILEETFGENAAAANGRAA